MPPMMAKRTLQVSNFRIPRSHNPSKNCDMTFTAEAVRHEMQRHVKDVAALAPNDSRKSALAFAASVLRLPYERVRSLFYGNARRIDAHEADQIRAYVQAATELIEARADYERQRAQFVSTHPGLARLAPPPLARDEVPASPTVRPRSGETR